MNPECLFCGSEMLTASDRLDIPGYAERTIPARRFWLECRALECKARGPAMQSPEAAALAVLQILHPA